METSEPPRSRRSILRRAGVGAGALTIGTALVPLTRLFPAAAQTKSAEGPTDEDIAAFAESVELAIAEAYATAVSRTALSAPLAATMRSFVAHHQEHATALGAAAGSAAEGKANAKLLATVIDQLRNAANERAVLQIAFDLENGAAATHLFALGAMKSASALRLAASILPVESQHAVVFGQAVGKSLADCVPAFENESRALDPEKFPTTPPTSTTTSTTTK